MTSGAPLSHEVARCRRRHTSSRRKRHISDGGGMMIEECCPSTSQPSCSNRCAAETDDKMDAVEKGSLPKRRSARTTSMTSTGEDQYPMLGNDGHRVAVARNAKTRRRRVDSPTIRSRYSLAVVGYLLLCAIVPFVAGITERRCGPVDIRNTPTGFRLQHSTLGDPNTIDHRKMPNTTKVVDCTIIEGSFTMSFIYSPPGVGPGFKNDDFPIFPYLTEITGSLLVFETNGLKDLNRMFPELRVIGGMNLIQHYALIIYQNRDLEYANLRKLSVIRNGGVRITDNRMLCWHQTIDWKRMILGKVNDVVIDDAVEQHVVETGKVCPAGPCEADLAKAEKECRHVEMDGDRTQSCFDDKTCQKMCQYELLEDNKPGPGCAPNGDRCHDECIGGCEKAGDATACYACAHLYYKGKCVPKCDAGLFVLLDRRCVTEKACLGLSPKLDNKSVHIKAVNGICSHRCPEGYEQHPTDAKKCQLCDGKCTVVCPGNYSIDNFSKALAIRRCNVIEGSLTIEMRGSIDSSMANELNLMFLNLHTIRGYLQVLRSPLFLTLHTLKNLRVIEGKFLYQDKYALSILENINLRKLFDEPSTNLTILSGAVQFHNNRMLCFNQIRSLMSPPNKFPEMSESDQSPSSNGDKAICEDARIEVNLTKLGSDYFGLIWNTFNTTDIDHRKFLGYEVFFKEVPAIDPEMTIDDDRSACIDSWQSIFIPHVDSDNPPPTIDATLDSNNRIKPHTIYAYYVATQMVHHPGAKNGISKIGFVTTLFSVPDPPVIKSSSKTAEGISINWEPPHRPNGVITYYTVTWRELNVDTAELAERFCSDDTSLALSSTSFHNHLSERDEEPTQLTTAAPSLTSLLPKDGTCSAVVGCCACPKMPNAEQADADAEFENNLLNEVLVQKCDSDADPIGCAVAGSFNSDNEDLEGEDEEEETPAERIRRNSEAYDRQRRRMYRRVHAIRSSGQQNYEQFSALIMAKIRSRRAIEDSARIAEMLEEKKTTMPTMTTAKFIVTTTGMPLVDGDDGNLTSLGAPKEHQLAGVSSNENVTSTGGQQTYTIRGLKHFTSYAISVSACQNTSVEHHFCSPPGRAVIRKRTKHLDNIDRVDNTTIRAVFLNDTNSLLVTWDAPNNTNGGIKGYIIQMLSTDDRTTPQKCQGAKKNWSSDVQGVVFSGLADGEYRVAITAYSTYMNGEQVVSEEIITVFTPGFWTIERIFISIGLLLLFFALVGLIVYYYVRKFYGDKVKAMAAFMNSNPEYNEEKNQMPEGWELKSENVVLGAQVGEGSFGKVYIGCGNNQTSKKGDVFGPCAIKINNNDPAVQDDGFNYLAEANVMKNFRTNFIVKLYGVIEDQIPHPVVMELMELGNLRDYLRSKRDDEVFNENMCEYYGVIPTYQYIEWAAQIADGMSYLESLKFVHRDLAARNCMINPELTVKIGDFGMARDLFYHDYYKPSGKRMMPVRWMSPESLKDGKFDSKTDAWAYGVVLYEMVTLGAQPYIGLSNDEVLNYIGMARKVIKQPQCCSDYWYRIMTMCWRYNPNDRPTFSQIVHLFSGRCSKKFCDASFALNNNSGNQEEGEELDMEGIVDIEVQRPPEMDRRMTDSIQMREFRPTLSGLDSRSTLSVNDDGRPLLSGEKPKKRRGSLDDEYALMNHSRGPSDPEVHNFGCSEGDYVERDVQMDAPTRRNTGASNSSYGAGYCLQNRGGSNERAGLYEKACLTDASGSGHLYDGDYVEKDLSMDTRRSTGASTISYGNPQPNWTSNRGSSYYQSRPSMNGRGDRLTHLPGTAHIQKSTGDYVETEAKNSSPSRNGNGPLCPSSRTGKSPGGFGENDPLTEDVEHPLA